MRVPLVTRLFALSALVVAGVSAMAFTTTVPGHAGQLPRTVNGKHVMWSMGSADPTSQVNKDNMIFHGGLVETKPAAYLIYWGPQWKAGFKVTHTGGRTYTNRDAMRYLNTFFASLGGSQWAAVQTQYCQNVPAGTADCKQYPYAQYITNPKNQLHGVWIDPSPVPATIATTGLAENYGPTQDPIAQEATKAAQHFGYDINATYLIMTPPGITATAYGTVYCAYHTETTVPGSHGVRYAFIPFVPEQGASCGGNSVNKTDDAFGHGYFDGYSIVSGHEYAEAITDPDNIGFQDGWNDASTSENGDKCAYMNLQNDPMSGKKFAVQPMWSNRANGGAGACAHTP